MLLESPRKAIAALVLAGALLATAEAPAIAAGPHVGVSIGVGPFWWGPPYWAFYPPPPRYYYPYPYWDPYWYPHWPPPVVMQEPPVYVQRPPAVPEPPDGPYWYYCGSAREYYPTVKQCPEPWIKVPPRPE